MAKAGYVSHTLYERTDRKLSRMKKETRRSKSNLIDEAVELLERELLKRKARQFK